MFLVQQTIITQYIKNVRKQTNINGFCETFTGRRMFFPELLENSDIIMLDEFLASFHSELVEDIVEMIKTKLSNKLVLFTLHQANVGMFDNVINIEEYRCCND